MAKVLTLSKLKELTGDDTYDFRDSKVGKRGSVYGEDGRVGLIKQGLKEADLAADKQNIVCVQHEIIGWVFTLASGGTRI